MEQKDSLPTDVTSGPRRRNEDRAMAEDAAKQETIKHIKDSFFARRASKWQSLPTFEKLGKKSCA